MRILMAGGGTGGHIIPGISLAEEIKKKQPSAEILFVSTGKPLEKRLYEQFQFPFKAISAKPLSKSPKKMAGFCFNTCQAILQSLKIIHSFKPEVIVGLGGYGAAPVLLAAKLCRIPFFILEQNAIPGSVNKLFAPLSQKVCCQFEHALQFFSRVGLLTGNPIRSSLRKEVKNAREQLGLEQDRFTVLVMGGSQGAQAINRCFAETAKRLSQEAPELKLQLIHLTGAKEMDSLAQTYQEANIPHRLFTFLNEMELAYASCDLIVCRAGGTSLAEITALGLPSILVPFPYAKDNHQFLNALEIERKGAALVCQEELFTPEKLISYLKEFSLAPEKLSQMSDKAREIGSFDAGTQILSLIESTLEQAA